MKCEACNRDAYAVYVGDDHKKRCSECHKMGDLTKDFSRDEFECQCDCGFDGINLDFVKRLQRIRDDAGVMMPVNSGCRCRQHNKDVGGSEYSDHLTGEGVDIGTPYSSYRYKIIRAAMKEGIPRIGIAKTFIHLGVNADNDEGVLWVY